MENDKIDINVYLENINKELLIFLEERLSQLRNRYYFYNKIDPLLFKFYNDFSLSIKDTIIPSLSNMISEYMILISDDTDSFNLVIDGFVTKAFKMMRKELDSVIIEFEAKILETLSIMN